MRAVVAVVGWMMLAAPACGGEQAPTASSGCASAVLVDGEPLLGVPVDDPRSRWPRLGEAITVEEPTCQDGGPDASKPQSVSLRSFEAVPPAVALADPSGPDRIASLFLGEGYFTQLPSHPLHRGRFRSDERPDLEARQRCAKPIEQRGTVAEVYTYNGAFTLRPASGRTSNWQVDAFTRLRARGAVARLRRGNRVTVQGKRCTRGRRLSRRIVFSG